MPWETRTLSQQKMSRVRLYSILKVMSKYLQHIEILILSFHNSGDLFTKNKEDVKAREAELSAQGQYFSASYAAERGARSKEESGEKGGAAVIPICLPLCCAAPCVIM